MKKICTAVPPVTKELSEDEIKRKTKAIIDEYLHVQDIKVKEKVKGRRSNEKLMVEISFVV
jgi:hypothetical protein